MPPEEKRGGNNEERGAQVTAPGQGSRLQKGRRPENTRHIKKKKRGQVREETEAGKAGGDVPGAGNGAKKERHPKPNPTKPKSKRRRIEGPETAREEASPPSFTFEDRREKKKPKATRGNLQEVGVASRKETEEIKKKEDIGLRGYCITTSYRVKGLKLVGERKDQQKKGSMNVRQVVEKRTRKRPREKKSENWRDRVNPNYSMKRGGAHKETCTRFQCRKQLRQLR